MQQAERRIAQQGHDRRPLPSVDEAGIFTEIDVFVAMQPILNAPVAAPQRQQPRWISRLRGQAGDPVAKRPLGCAMLAPGVLQAEDLSGPWPVQVASQIGGGDQFPPFWSAAV